MALFGASIGPLLTGYLSDAFAASTGIHSLGYGLTVTTIVTIIGAVMIIIAGSGASYDIRGAKPVSA
jgi:hypothetical protein